MSRAAAATRSSSSPPSPRPWKRSSTVNVTSARCGVIRRGRYPADADEFAAEKRSDREPLVAGFDLAPKEVGRKMHDRTEQSHRDRLPGQPAMEGDERVEVGRPQRAEQDRTAVAQQPGSLLPIPLAASRDVSSGECLHRRSHR